MFASKDVFLKSGAAGGYTISRSVRLRSSASAYFNRTFSTPTSSTIWTWSAWVKRGGLTGTYRLFGASTTTYLTFNSSDQLNLTLNGVSAATTTAVYRDPSSWYHIVYQQNGSAQTIYVNNVSVATGTTAASVFNTAISHQLGAANTTNFFDGYLTEINFIDGQALTPSSFGQYNSYGVWSPLKYTGTYGTNGFYLNFSDNSAATAAAIGKDSSGNGNNWTPNNISVTAGATYDSMVDVPTPYADGSTGRGNYATLNPVQATSATLSNANLNYSIPASYGLGPTGTVGASSGKWYWEVVPTSGNQLTAIGVASVEAIANGKTQVTASSTNPVMVYEPVSGSVYVNGSVVTTTTTSAANDTVAIAYDAGANTAAIYKNNTLLYTATLTGTSGGAMPFLANPSGIQAAVGYVNFGQRPFTYTPPTGFNALNTQNLSAGTITTSGSFTGNASTDGPFVYLNGVPTAMTINGNSVTFGTNADHLANGFKVRSSSASYNASGSNTYSITTTGANFKNAIAQTNP